MRNGKRKLNPKDAKAMVMKLKGASNAEIAKALGHKNTTPNSAESVISKRLRRAKDSEGFAALMNRLGATDEKIVDTALAALGAEETRYAIKRGQFTDKRVLTDHATRLRAAELLGRWKGVDKTSVPEEKPATLTVILTTQKTDA